MAEASSAEILAAPPVTALMEILASAWPLIRFCHCLWVSSIMLRAKAWPETRQTFFFFEIFYTMMRAHSRPRFSCQSFACPHLTLPWISPSKANLFSGLPAGIL